MRRKHVFILYISSSSLKKEINACVRINIDVCFYKNHDGQLRDMSRNYPRLIFFRRGNYRAPFLTVRRRITWNRFHISEVHYLFVSTSQTNKSVLNWVVLILMDKLCLEYFWWQTDLCKCITYSQYDFVKEKHLEITFKYLNHIGTSFHCLWLWCYQWFLALNP